MNQQGYLVSVGSLANQYWQLIYAMLFNLRVIGFLVGIFLSLGLAAFVLGIIFPGFGPLGLVFGFVSLLIIGVIGFVGLPIGMLVLITNKNISLMANVRHQLFFIAFVFSLLIVGINSVSLLNSEKSASAAMLFWGWLLICPPCFACAIFIGSKDIGMSMFSPLLMAVIAKTIFSYVSAINPGLLVYVSAISPAVLAVGNLVVWALFYVWWMRFSPSGGIKKSIFLQTEKHQTSWAIWEKLLVFKTKKISTPMGTFLLGHSDHVISFLKRFILMYSCSLAFAVYLLGAFKVGHLDVDQFRLAVFVACAYSFILMTMDFYSKKMMMNLKRAWLVFPGNREEIFHYLELKFWRGLRLLVVLNVVMLALFLLVTQSLGYLLYVFAGVILMSGIVVFDFYWDVCCYKKDQHLGHVKLRKAFVTVGLVLLVCYYLVEKYSVFNVFGFKDFIVVFAIAIVMVLLKPVRKLCMNRFKMVDI